MDKIGKRMIILAVSLMFFASAMFFLAAYLYHQSHG